MPAFRSKNLDGLRAFAIILVMLHHVLTWSGHAMFRTALPDLNGAHLFFILSGFLITTSLLNNKHRPRYYSSFFTRRCLKIIPLYYLYLVVLWFLAPESHHMQMSFWFFVGNIGILTIAEEPGLLGYHLWSMSVQEQFYLVWPAAIKKLAKEHLLLLLSLMFIVGTCVRVLTNMLTGDWFAADLNPLCAGDTLSIGAFAALLMKESPEALRKHLFTFQMATPVLYVLAWCSRDLAIGATVDTLLLGSIFFWALAAKPDSIESKILSSRPAVRLGSMSYSVYMLHMVAIYFSAAVVYGLCDIYLPQLGPSVRCLIMTAVWVPLLMVAASLTYNRIEKPFAELASKQSAEKSSDESPMPSDTKTITYPANIAANLAGKDKWSILQHQLRPLARINWPPKKQPLHASSGTVEQPATVNSDNQMPGADTIVPPAADNANFNPLNK